MPSALTLTLPMPIHPQLCWLLPWHAGPLCRLALRVLALPMLVFYLLLKTADGASACTLNQGVVSFDVLRMTELWARALPLQMCGWRWRLRASEVPGVSRQDQRRHGWGFKRPQLGSRSPRVFATGVCDAEPGRLFGASHVFVSLPWMNEHS